MPCSPTLFETLREFTNLGKITILEYDAYHEDKYAALKTRVSELVNGDVSRIHGIVAHINEHISVPEFFQRVQRISPNYGTLEIRMSGSFDLSLLTFSNIVKLDIGHYEGVLDGPKLLNVKNLILRTGSIEIIIDSRGNLRNLETLEIYGGGENIVLPQLNLPHLQYLEIYRFQMLSLDFILSMPKLEILKISLPSQPIQISPKVAERLAKIKVLEIKRDRKVLGKPKICQSLKDLVF